MHSREANEQVANLIGPIYKLLERRAMQAAEASIAGMALWTLDCIEGQRLRADLADEAFTLLVVYVGDHAALPTLSEEAQELLLEAQHLHHWRDSVGADASVMRQLAERILTRGEQPAIG